MAISHKSLIASRSTCWILGLFGDVRYAVGCNIVSFVLFFSNIQFFFTGVDGVRLVNSGEVESGVVMT